MHSVVSTLNNSVAKKRSIIWNIEKEKLQYILDNSNSNVEVLTKLGFDGYNGNHRTLTARLMTEDFDLDKFNNNKKMEHSNRALKARLNQYVPNNKVFCENSTYTSNSNIKPRLLELGVDYKCSECGIGDIYNNKIISLQLDHINGINNDNRLNNLRFLCPNCHSQTDTFSGKRHRNKYLCDCGNEKLKGSSQCDVCFNSKRKTKIEWPNKEFFEKKLWEIPTTHIATEIGVSDKAIENHIKKLGLDKPPRGYWKKFGANRGI